MKIVGFSDSGETPILGVNGAVFLASGNTAVIIKCGSTTVGNGGDYTFPVEGTYSDGVVAGYDGSLSTAVDFEEANLDAYSYSNSGISGMQARVRIFIKDKASTEGVTGAISKEDIYSAGDTASTWESTYIGSAAVYNPESGNWPTQKELRSMTSIFGSLEDAKNAQASFSIPYTLYDGKSATNEISCHRLVGPIVQKILQEVLDFYGLERIKALGLDQYAGCFVQRRIRGGSSAWSIHSWGMAFDFAAGTNAMDTKAPKATLSASECSTWWKIWESYGAVSLGRQRDFDWMHVQFARL